MIPGQPPRKETHPQPVAQGYYAIAEKVEGGHRMERGRIVIMDDMPKEEWRTYCLGILAMRYNLHDAELQLVIR